jgi:transposase
MTRINSSAEDSEEIKRLRYADPHPKVRRRMEALWLKRQGLSHAEIGRLTGISGNHTLREYLRRFQSGGVEQLREINWYTPTSALDAHRD